MKKLKNLIDTLKNIRTKVIIPTLNDSDIEKLYTELAQKKLKTKGETSSGQKLITNVGYTNNTGSYSPRTIAMKRKEGKEYRFVTLEDTGNFYKSFILNANSGGVKIAADFTKENSDIPDNFTNMFPDKGEFIFEVLKLQPKDFQEFKKEFFAKFKEKFNEAL